MIAEGTTLNGRYRIDRRVGDGGMAVVYRGQDLLLGREVAVKVLRSQYAADPGFRARFEREARAAAGFRHPNIIQIYDVGEDQGTPWFVMEYVEGPTLKQVIDDEAPFHPDDVAALLRQLGAALDFAHERGYVHRDVKPQNVLVDADGHAKVVDFGIAKGLGDSDLTATGTGLGTVHYISPEQASGLMATPSSDVYSAGVVAFEMLTGRLPFESDTPVGVAVRHVNEDPPPPSAFLPSVPPAVDAIVLRALAKDPTQRFPSAGALAQAMTNWRRYLPPGWSPESTSGRGTTPWVTPGTATARVNTRGTVPSRSRTPTGEPRRGGSAWWVGLLLLIGIAALIWFGFQNARRIPGFGAGPPAAPSVIAAIQTPVTDGGVSADGANPGTGGAPTIAPVVDPPVAEPTPAPSPTPAPVAMPQLIGQTPDAARVQLDALGLTLEVGDAIASDAVPAGQIAHQTPDAGSPLPIGSTVTAQPSSGPPGVDLDAMKLVGVPADRAEVRLREAGLDVARQEIGSKDVPKGSVVAVDPAHHADPGQTVTLQVSVGNKVQLPTDLFGMAGDRATRQLEQAGFRVTGSDGVSRSTIEAGGVDLAAQKIEDGDVVGIQNHQFGDWVDPNSRLTLVVYDRRKDNGG